MNVKIRDRHGEHADPNLPICDHGDHVLRIGDKLTVDSKIGETTIAEIVIEWTAVTEITIVVNSLDYLIEKAKRGE